MRRHMASYENVTCNTSKCACMCVRVCARACVPVCVINENKYPFQDFYYLISLTLLIYPSVDHVDTWMHSEHQMKIK